MPLPINLPNPFADEDEINAALMNALANALEELVAAPGTPATMYRGTMFHDESNVIAGGAIDITLTSQSGASIVYASQATPALNDEWENGLYLAADTYTLKVDIRRSTGGGIISFYVDDVLEGTVDTYGALAAYATVSVANIVIADDGWHTIRGKIESKHASSSGYACNIVKMAMIGSLA